MVDVRGTLKVDIKNQRITVEFDHSDLMEYYAWQVSKQYWIKFRAPLHGIHITLTNKKLQHIHTNVNWKRALRMNGMQVGFSYDTRLNVGGGEHRGFWNFYLKVHSKDIQDIKLFLNIVEENYKGMHITLGNTKEGVINYWPEMITIKDQRTLQQKIKDYKVTTKKTRK